MRKILTVLLILMIAFAFIGCNDKDDDDDNGNKDPITKTYTITLKDGALVFTVEYKAYPTDAEPAYLTYIKERLEVVANSNNASSIAAVDFLLTKGNSFKITIEYAEPMYTGMDWDTTLQSFKIHNDWISTATGTDLSAVLVRDLFNAVEAE